MSGNRTGGAKAAATNKAKHGADFYKRIGKLGGSAKAATPKGFAANPKLAKSAGKKGGLSRWKSRDEQEAVNSDN